MGIITLDKICITPLKRITTEGGDVLHAIKSSEHNFKSFGEAYFSFIEYNHIKAWKMHSKMTLNLVVPVGNIKFKFVQSDMNAINEIIIGDINYSRITVPPGIWFGFQGLSKSNNLLLNIADIQHNPQEVTKINIKDFKFKF
jgi:dTDP-4-dehydrorhamnose 3,5-epimerase